MSIFIIDTLWFWIIGKVALFTLKLYLILINGECFNFKADNTELIPSNQLIINCDYLCKLSR